MQEPSKGTTNFAEFEIDQQRRRLLRNGETISLNAKAYDLLSFLADNSGRIVTKDEILHSVWDDKFVEEANLVVQISNLRRALGETASSPRFLITVPGKGYKFVGGNEQNGFVIETHSVSELTIEQREEITGTQSVRQRPQFKWLAAGTATVLVTIAATVGVTSFWSGNAVVKPDGELRHTKLTTSGRVVAATMSPDGRFAIYSQKEQAGESLWLRQIESGSENRIAEPRPIEYVGMTVSPDSQFIYASVFSKNEIDPTVEKIPIIGGVTEKIPDVSTGSSISISPDGKQFAFTSSNNGENETLFGVANIDGSNSRILIRAKHDKRYLSMFKSSPVAWSPTGNEVALSVEEKNGKSSRSMLLMVDPTDGSERYLTERHWRSIEDLAWVDSDNLAFIATEEDGPADQLWTFSRSSGEAKRLTNDLRSHNWLAVANGKLLTVQLTPSSSVRSADVDLDNGKIDTRELLTASEYVDEIDWENDGRIAYVSRAGGSNEIWRMNADGSGQKQLTNGANVAFGMVVSPIDGKFIFASRRDGKRGIWSSTSDGKELQRLSEGGDQAPDISEDGKIVFHRGLGYAEGIFVASIDGGDAKLLRERCYFPAISPDGRTTACYFMDLEDNRKWRIALVSNETGELVKKITLPIPVYERQIRFHPSGKYLTQIFSSGENLHLIILPLDGGEAKIIEGLGKGASNLPEWSADGKRFLYPVITESQDAVLFSTSH